MLRLLRSWKGGYAVSVVCLVIAVVRTAAGEQDWITAAALGLAVCYALAAAAERRQDNVRLAFRRVDGLDPDPWPTRPSRLRAWLGAERGYARDPDGGPPAPRVLTWDRVGAVLAIAAAVVGMALVLHDRGTTGENGPTAGSQSLHDEVVQR